LDKRESERLAAAWIEEFGPDVEWHLTEKIRQLEQWGDSDGAQTFRGARALIRVRSVSPVLNLRTA
jgi:hypothetical protein